MIRLFIRPFAPSAISKLHLLQKLSAAARLLFERVAATPANAFLASIRQNFVTNPSALVARRAKQLNVGDGQRAFFFDDSALHVLLRIGPRVPLDDSGMFHGDRSLGRIHAQHPAGFAAIASGQYAHFIASLDACRR
jgi:hypothetical protein